MMTFHTTITIASREYLVRIRARSFLIMTVLFPLIVLSPFLATQIAGGGSGAESTGQFTLALADATGGTTDIVAALTRDTLPDGRAATVVIPTEFRNEELTRARDLVERDAYDGLLMIPAGWLRGESARFVMGESGTRAQKRVRRALRDVAIHRRLVSEGVSPARIPALTAEPALTLEHIIVTSTMSGSEQVFAPMAMVLLMYISLLTYGMMTMRSVVQDKASRIIETLVSVASPTELMFGKVLGIGAVGATQVILWAVMALGGAHLLSGDYAEAIGNVVDSLPVLPFVLLYVSGLALFLSLYAGIGAACSNEDDATQLARPISLVIALPMFLLSSAIGNPGSIQIVALSYIRFFPRCSC